MKGNDIGGYGKKYNTVWQQAEQLGGVFTMSTGLPAGAVSDVRKNGATFMDFGKHPHTVGGAFFILKLLTS